MVRIEEKELKSTLKGTEQVQIVEQEITLTLLNQKLNYIIQLLEGKK